MLNRSVAELLEAFSSPDPTPGGGSASALAGALGASLLMMVASLPKTRTNNEGERAKLAEARNRLMPMRDRLIELIALDSRAYDRVVGAYRLPKTTDEERAMRSQEIQRALVDATEVPLEVMRICERALSEGTLVSRNGVRSALSDVGVGVELIAAALRGACLNVQTNLTGRPETEYSSRVRADMERLAASASHELERAREQIG